MRRYLAIALVLLAGLPLALAAQEAIRYYDFGANPNTLASGFIRSYVTPANGTNTDTIGGPMVPVEGARRVQFKIRAVSANTCSLAFIYVTNKDTTEAALQTTALWTDANGLPGLTIVDNMSSNNFSDSLGGRTIELLAPGSGRIPWLYARCAFRMKAADLGSGSLATVTQVRSARFYARVQSD